MKGTKDIAKIATPHSVVAHMVSPEEQAAADKILRDKIPRKHHGEWNEVNRRPNPIDFLPSQMLVELNGLILQPPFAFYRGQRWMQPALAIFLGWVTSPNGRQF